MTIRVLMQPHKYQFRTEESGIRRVVEAYFKHLPDYDIELVLPDTNNYDLLAVHAGQTGGDVDVCHCHGLYWTEDYKASRWEWHINSKVINAVRHAKATTVPSAWVAESFQRDMRFTPHIVPHGIDWDEWQEPGEKGNYVLWNKNRPSDACDPTPLVKLAQRFDRGLFCTTFLPPDTPNLQNVKSIGMIPHGEMKKLVKGALVYLSVVKETFGIGVLEAMAAGVPVLGWRNGGNVDLIEHGVNGFLAEPGDYDELEDGLHYCIAHRRGLGDHGREMAREWTWERTAEQVAEIYRQALNPSPPTVGVVIPFFNKTEGELRNAIESAQAQTSDAVRTIVVVDDGSQDPTVAQKVVNSIQGADGRVELLRQDNRGVAIARNRGVDVARDEKYICCLDSDDAIEPEFIDRCVKALEADNSLGIAYTGLQWVKPDGSTGTSEWPGEFDYDKQIERHNQVPTCCVFRREMWERLGGYRQRYAPKGCGAEDAEFWLRAGSIGYGAKKVTKKPLFVYAWQSGMVSGDSSYQEVDWTSWHPWAGDDGDGRHPFASVASPVQNSSHPVRQYDEPLVSVIIPVGPGHEEEVINALDSLEAQTFRKWEVIVVDDTGTDATYELHKAYPYAQMIMTGESNGAGAARNEGARFARAPFLVFLDADDALRPTCLDKMIRGWHVEKAITYTDYIGLAQVDDPARLAPELQERMYEYDDKTKRAVIGYRAAEYDCQRAQQQPEGEKPWIWCNVTALIPKAWHDAIGGFDESMPSWEDVDYHIRMAQQGHCYLRIPEELMVYRFHTGGRRETGRQTHAELVQYLRQKYQGIEIMGCRGCGKSKTATSRSVVQRNPRQARQSVQPKVVDDAEFVMVSYNHRNRGTHRVIGPALFPQPIPGAQMIPSRGGYRFDYGVRAGAGQEQFLVHRGEVELDSTMFTPVNESARALAPKEERAAPPPPEPMHEPEPEPEPPPIPDYDWPESLRDDGGDYNGDGVVDKDDLLHLAEVVLDRPPAFDLQKLPGIGPKLAEQMEADGVRTRADVLALGVDGLALYQGINRVRAEMIVAAMGAMA